MPEDQLDKLNPMFAKDFDDDPEDFEIEKGRDFIAHVKPVVARTAMLCGYNFDFKKQKNPKTGKFTYIRQHLDSRKYVGRKEVTKDGVRKLVPTGQTVLPEILKKLTHHLNKTIDVNWIEYVESKPKRAQQKKE